MTDTFERLKAALADRYAIERELGAGGMATVYLAEDLKLHRKVAVKVLRPDLAAALGPERFLREIKITAKLNHPHILPLLDSGEVDSFLYYVMPYVEGESLRDRLDREKQLPVEVAIRISCQVAAALSYAHSHGVIHRDIKPGNIMLSHGEAVVADFGIGRAISAAGGEDLTETGLAIGTPAYMSPEQGSGERELGGRSDIYSLGCVLYETLVGEPPFGGSSAQAILARHAMEPVPSIRVVRSTVAEYVERAIQKAMAKVAADRFETPTQFAEALVGGPEPGVAGGALESEIRDERRRRRTWKLGAIIAAGGVAAAAVIWGVGVGGGGFTYVVVGPIQTTSPDFSIGEPLGLWAVAEEVSAILASDPAWRIVDPRKVTSLVLSDASEELTREDWLQIAEELGAAKLVLFDTESLVADDSVSLVSEGRTGRTPTAKAIFVPFVEILVLNVPSGDSVSGFFAGRPLPVGGSFLTRKVVPDDADVVSGFGDLPDQRLVARGVASMLRSPRREMFPWGMDSMLGSIEPSARPRIVAAVEALESGLYLEAVDQFQQALVFDPDFTLAAIGLLQAGSLVGDEYVAVADGAARRAWELRDRLTTRDREFVAAYMEITPNYPTPATRTEFLEFLETVIFSYLEEGRLATTMGRRRDAVWAYHRYLTLVRNPDPDETSEVEEVRAELARMTGRPPRQ